jgi:hypothetical protein
MDMLRKGNVLRMNLVPSGRTKHHAAESPRNEVGGTLHPEIGGRGNVLQINLVPSGTTKHDTVKVRRSECL